MIDYDSKNPLISIHIPKTGGVSFVEVLKIWFGDKLKLHYFDENRNRMPAKYNINSGNFCIHGHFNKKRKFGVFDYYPFAKQFISIIREPLDLHISNYFFRKKLTKLNSSYINGISKKFRFENMDAYLENTNSFILNYFPWDINEDNYKKILNENFIFVGDTDNMQKTVKIISQKLKKDPVLIGTMNKSYREEEPSQPAINRWKNKHKLEYLIYYYLKEINN